MRRFLVPSLAVAAAALAGGLWYGHATSAAGCASDAAIHGVQLRLSSEFHLDSVIFNDVRTRVGGPFARRQDCTAEVAQISSQVRAAEMNWRRVDYTSTRRPSAAIDAGAASSDIAIRLGDTVPLAPVSVPYWRRILGMF